MQQIDIIEIMQLLPHRYPLLLIDKVIKWTPHEEITAVKNVTINEPQFMGHFPDKPIMPGVLIIEAMAQASAILVMKSCNMDKNNDVYFMSIENSKFRKIVSPGNTMYINSKIQHARKNVWKFTAIAKVDDIIVAESSFTAMVKNRVT